MSQALDFGSREAANYARDAYDLEGDRRFKSINLQAAEIESRELDELVGMAAESRLDRQSAGGQAALTQAEKQRLDFAEVDFFSAASAKATLQQQGVEDWMAVFDSSLTLDEAKGLSGAKAQRNLRRQLDEMGDAAAVGRTAARDPTGRRERGLSEATDEMLARGFQRSQSELEQHAVEGVRAGHAEAKAELRRMGWSEPDIQEIVATGQVEAALTPGQAVRLSNGMKTSPRNYSRARRAHAERSARAQQVDERLQAPRTTNYDRWRSAPSRYDFPGVDTVRPLSGFFDNEGQYQAFRQAANRTQRR